MPVPTKRGIGADQRHRLPLHVGTHQRPVRVVVLKERNERRGDGHELLRRDVDRGDVLGLHQPEVALLADRDQILGEPAASVHRGIGLGYDQTLFLHGGEIAAPCCTMPSLTSM